MANDIAGARSGLSPVVEIASGKLRGARGRNLRLQGRALRRLDRGTQPVHAAAAAAALGRRARGARLSPATRRNCRTGPSAAPELETILGPADTTPEGEDCLTLNVWTPGLGDGGKRPVMVWLHGGAFAYGSGNRAVTDGANLARRGDVVVVSVNHRLNIFGFLHLADIGGASWTHSGNAGMLDIVAGASLGARQHRAFRRRSRQRHDLWRVGRRRQGQRAAGDAGGARAVPPRDHPERRGDPRLDARAGERAGRSGAEGTRARPRRMRAAADPAGRAAAGGDRAGLARGRPLRWPLLDRYDFGPVVDGGDLPQHPAEPDAPAIADDVPLMIGGTREESAFFLADDDAVWNGTLSEAELRAARRGGGRRRDRRSARRLSRRDAAGEPGRPADRGIDRLEFLDPHGVAGRALRGAASGAGLHVLARLAEPGAWRPPQGASRDGPAVCLRQCRCAGHDRRRSGRPRTGGANFRDLDRLCPEREAGQSGDPVLAAYTSETARR